MNFFKKRVHYIQQFDNSECGICVLLMILHYYGAYYSKNDVLNYYKTSRDGISIKMLIELFSYFGLDAQAYYYNVREYGMLEGPFIVNWEKNHYVIVEKMSTKFVQIVDSNYGVMKMTIEEFEKKHSGIAVLVKKGETFKKKRKKRNYKWLIELIKRFKRQNIFLLISSFVSRMMALIIPLYLGKVVAGIETGNGNKNDFWYAIIIVAIYVLVQLCNSTLITFLGEAYEKYIKEFLNKKLLKLDYSKYENLNRTKIIYALDSISTLKNIIINDYISVLWGSFTVVVLNLMLWHIDYQMFFVIAIFSVFIVVIMLYSRSFLDEKRKSIIKYESSISTNQFEIIFSMLGIRTMSIEKEIYKEWKTLYSEYYSKNLKYKVIYNMVNVFLSASNMMMPLLLVMLIYRRISCGSMTVRNAITFYMLSQIMISTLLEVLLAVFDIMIGCLSVEHIVDILLIEEDEKREGLIETNYKEKIVLNNVNFAYSSIGKNVLNDITFNIRENEKIALVGKSGAGKSTILKLLAGLYCADSGDILFDGKDVNLLKLHEKKKIAYISQNVTLLNKSIAENIMLGNTGCNKEDIEDVCRIVNIHDDIMNMPMKYETVVTEEGANLSGGQCQRILLARMLLLKPEVFLLDEATSAIDYMNEKKIMEYLMRLDCIIMMITHKRDFLQLCDRIIAIDQGKIVSDCIYTEFVNNDVNLNMI